MEHKMTKGDMNLPVLCQFLIVGQSDQRYPGRLREYGKKLLVCLA